MLDLDPNRMKKSCKYNLLCGFIVLEFILLFGSGPIWLEQII